MVGNNACGMHSLIWGSTRDHLLSCKAILADGSDVVFEALGPDDFHAKRRLPTLEGRIYEGLYQKLSDPSARREIEAEFPKPQIRRRNNGYAIDLLLRSNVFTPGGPDFNMCTLVCGSEGTLCLVTEATLRLHPRPIVLWALPMEQDGRRHRQVRRRVARALRSTASCAVPLILQHKARGPAVQVQQVGPLWLPPPAHHQRLDQVLRLPTSVEERAAGRTAQPLVVLDTIPKTRSCGLLSCPLVEGRTATKSASHSLGAKTPTPRLLPHRLRRHTQTEA